MISLRQVLPWIALLITIIIWASYLVVVRAGVSTSLSPYDIGLVRTLPAAIVLLPFTLRIGVFPHSAGYLDLALIGIIGSVAFILLLAHGLRFAPVADAGVFTPSMLPIFVAVLSAIFVGAHYRRQQIFGIVLIIIGASAIGGYSAISQSDGTAWKGHALFLAASISWAIFTVRFRASSLSPLAGTAVMASVPACIFLILAICFGTGLFSMPGRILSLHLAQGFAAGLIANFTYFFAIKNLGPYIPAASAALVPILAGIGGWIFLEESIELPKLIGMTITCCGVVFASGVFGHR